jgi:hypothetical protein
MVRSTLCTATFVVALAACIVPRVALAQNTKLASPEETREANLRAYAELLRSDIRAQKSAILTELMEFTEGDDAKFWPIYREYEAELVKINDRRLALIKEYAANFAKMTDDVADRLARGALDVEGRRNDLKLRYYERFKSALGAKSAARFLQVENQMLLLLDLQIAASLPLVQ